MNKKFILCMALICSLVSIRSKSQSTVSFGNPVMVPADFAGFNGSNTIRTDMDFPYIDTDWLVDSVRQMAPGNLRFPPGSLANYWDWRIGHVQRAEDLPHGEEYAFDYGTMKYKDNTFDRFKGFVDRNGVSPIFVMNVLNSNKYYQTACLYYLRNLNLPLKYVEFGNELYNEHSSFMSNFPDAFAYARRCNEYASYMKSQPGMSNLKVAVVGATSRNNQPAYSRRNTWTQLVCDSLDNSVDAVTLHHYIGANVNGEQLTMSNINRFFASPFVAFDDLSPELASIKGAGKEAWLTETNIYDRSVCVNGSFAHGLLVGSILLTMNEDPTITKYCAHSMVGNGTWAMIYNDTAGLVMESYYYPNSPCLGNEPKTLPHHFSPAGSVVKMIGQSVRNSTTRRKLTFPGVPKLSADYNYDAVYGWYFDGPLAGNAVIMNLSNQPQTITIPSNMWNVTGGVYEHLTAGPGGLLDLVTKNPSLNPTIGGMKSSGVLAAAQTITLPAYSATRIYKKKNTGLVLSIGSTKICSGTQTTIVAEGGNSFTFSGQGITGYLADNVAIFSATAASTKNYTVTVTNNFGVTASAIITVYPKPVLSILTPPTVICGAGQPVSLKATLTGGNSALLKKFIWTPSENINTPDAANCTVYPTRSTTYTVFATDGQCFSAYDSVRVDITNEHEESLNLEVCTDQLPYNINLDFAKPGFTYKWYINNTQINTGTYLNANPSVAKTVYKIKIINNNDVTCVDSMEINLNTYKCCTSNTPQLTIAPGSRISEVCEIFQDYCTNSGIGFADGKMVENIPANIVINGTLYIDRNYSFINCPNIRFAEGAKMEVIEGPYKLLFEKCSLRLAGCATKMWAGIVTNEYNQEITLNNSYICDATSAITCKNDPNLFINNTTFDANYVSMTLMDNESSLKGLIENSRFTQTKPLIAPYAGKKTFAHFKLINVANFILGNNYGLPNTIENAEFGVYGENATVTAYNNHFNNIRSSDISKEYLASCIFIKNLNGYGNINDYTQLWPMYSVNAGHRNLQPEFGNKFSNCRNGIYVINAALNVYSSEFTNCRRSIKSVGSMLKKNYIQNNTMSNSFACIDFIYNKASEINIVGNTITTNNATTIDQTFFGVRVSDDPLAPSNTAILGNTIYSFGTYGIWIQNSRLADVWDNKIYMSHPAAIRESFGIYLENADSVDVDCNLVKGNGTTTTLMENKTGITISMAPLTRVRCNTVDRLAKGFEFLGNCDNSQIRNNDIKFLDIGLCVGAKGVTGGSIGPQPLQKGQKPNSNLFLGKYIATNGYASGKGKFGYAATLSSHSDLAGEPGTENQFLAFEEDSLQIPFPNLAVGPGATSLIPGYSSKEPRICEATCTSPNPEKTIPYGEQIDGGLLTQTLERIDEKLPYSDNEAVTWYMKKNLLQILESNTGLMNSNNDLTNTYNYLNASNIRQFEEAEKLIVKLSNWNGSPYGRDLILTQAEALNDAIMPSNKIEKNEQIINRLTLETLKGNLESVLVNNRTAIEQLAFACPYAEGNAVYKARAFYALLNEDKAYEDKQICNNRLPYTDIINFENIDIDVFPNPSKGLFYIKLLMEPKSNMMISIYNFTGQLVKTVPMTESMVAQIDMTTNSSGIYMYSISYDNKPITSGRFIIE